MIRPKLSRRLALALPLLLAACAGGAETPVTVTPPDYSYLTPLRLNVAHIDIDDSWVPPYGAQDLTYASPLPPVAALRRMAQDRLVASGGSGHAVFTIEDASITRTPDGLSGHFAVRLDIYTSGDKRAAYAEASVARVATLPQPGDEALHAALYTLTRQMMDDMNVELEYQVRRALHDWLQDTSSPQSAIPGAVQQQPLPPGS